MSSLSISTPHEENGNLPSWKKSIQEQMVWSGMSSSKLKIQNWGDQSRNAAFIVELEEAQTHTHLK